MVPRDHEPGDRRAALPVEEPLEGVPERRVAVGVGEVADEDAGVEVLGPGRDGAARARGVVGLPDVPDDLRKHRLFFNEYPSFVKFDSGVLGENLRRSRDLRSRR